MGPVISSKCVHVNALSTVPSRGMTKAFLNVFALQLVGASQSVLSIQRPRLVLFLVGAVSSR